MARRSLSCATTHLLLALCVWNHHEVDAQTIDVAGADVNDVAAAATTTTTRFRCWTATIFRLVTVDCTARNASSVGQLTELDRHRVNSLRLADNRLVRLDADEFGRVAAHLQQLYLARNLIADVHQHAFRSLRTLQVDTTQLTVCPLRVQASRTRQTTCILFTITVTVQCFVCFDTSESLRLQFVELLSHADTWMTK